MSSVLFSDVHFSHESIPILHHVNVQIEPGELIGVMGPNGGGKTTFLKLLMGFLTPTQGTIRIDGKAPPLARLKMGYVPQVFSTDRDFPITVYELVLLGALSKISFWGTYPSSIREKALILLEQFGLSSHKNKLFSSLSGGLAQRALLARALLSDPDLLLLDEPTANIDAPSSAMVFEILSSLKKKKTILLVSHDLRTITEQVDRILSVQGHVSSFLPKEICEHFALGLYHTPLVNLPANHLKSKESHVCCLR